MNANLSNINSLKKNLVLILFHATWCGHCIAMKPSWDELKKNHPRGVQLADVESEEVNSYQYSRNEEKIQGFPTLRLYYKDKLIKEYDGERNFESIYRFLNDFLKKNKNISKNNMLIMESKKGNKINKKLIKKVIQNKKNKISKKTKSSKKNNKKQLIFNNNFNNSGIENNGDVNNSNNNNFNNNMNLNEININNLYNEKKNKVSKKTKKVKKSKVEKKINKGKVSKKGKSKKSKK